MNSNNSTGHTTVHIKQPKMHRVRVVARKRYPLAVDLVDLYKRNSGYRQDPNVKSFIGHTRFATSSINVVSELHPHEWCPFHNELVWQLNQLTGKFSKTLLYTGVHITHNGDFDALKAYDAHMENGEVGLWLERILHVPNDTKGDSPKIAGCMDLMRVQGRWGAAARLAYVRVLLSSSTDVSGGALLSKTAPNTFPDRLSSSSSSSSSSLLLLLPLSLSLSEITFLNGMVFLNLILFNMLIIL